MHFGILDIQYNLINCFVGMALHLQYRIFIFLHTIAGFFFIDLSAYIPTCFVKVPKEGHIKMEQKPPTTYPPHNH